MDISFVIPCYCSSKTIANVVQEIEDTMKNDLSKSYEIILVNDNSKDDTWQVLKEIAGRNSNIIAIDFAKNFGQPSALLAGFSQASGEYIMTSDDDGQTPVCLVESFFEKMEEGFDIVCVKYTDRGRKSLFRKTGSTINEIMSKYILGKPEGIHLSSFFLAKKFVIDEMLKYKGPYPYIGGLMLRITSKIGYIIVAQRNRFYGESGYNFKKLLKLWVNGFTAFSIKPLRISIIIGFITVTCSLLMLVYLVIKKFNIPSTAIGYTSIMVSILFFSGTTLCMLGMIGEYVGRLYMCINNEPQYIIREKYRSEKNDEKIL